MDFKGNKDRIIESIKISLEKGAKLRIGPELEIPGYGCEDHFLEIDTITHSWEVLLEILKYTKDKDIMCDIGIPVQYECVIYNCRVIIYKTEILLIRPKIATADDGNYREKT